MINVAELIEKQKKLEYQNSILLAISHISSILLQSNKNTFDDDLHHAMEIMGEAAEVDRVYIWENSTKDEELFTSQVYEWSVNVEPQQDKSLTKNVSYTHDIPTWLEILSKGNCVNGLVSELSPTEKKILSAQGIISILVVPIFFHNRFWGFVGFDDCHSERAFSKNEEIILRSASELIANALIRNYMEQNIQYLETEVDKIYYDSLTGIYNRRYFDENIERIISAAVGSTLSLMMVDIDHFKKYNDTYGHLNGDMCLKVVAETLKNSLIKAEDFVARYGGEEFIVVLPNVDGSVASSVAERMLENVRKQNISHKGNSGEKRVTVSIGVTSGELKSASTAKDFISRADDLLYEAKQSGRNNYKFGLLPSKAKDLFAKTEEKY